MNSTKLGAILALAIGAQALGQNSRIEYQLELGGNNNAAGAGWENPVGCNPAFFTAGSTANGQTFSGSLVTWAARVKVTGTHTNGFVPAGVANAVFNLELRDNGGNLVASFGKGTATLPGTSGFVSTVNDGDGDGVRVSSCGYPADPDEAAAFAVSFSVDSVNRGRVIDGPGAGGPYLDYFQYPSTLGFPGGSTAVSGTLMGIGAGYSKFAGYGCPTDCGNGSGLNTAGVGRTTAASISCQVALGEGPIAEGQLNMCALPAGPYTLTLVPGAGNNLLNGNFACETDNPGAFAVKPDLASLGSTISFTWNGCSVPVTNRVVQEWRSIRSHSGLGELAIVLNPTATGNGVSGPTIDSRATATLGGIQKIQVVFDGTVAFGSAAGVTVTGRITDAAGTMGAPANYPPSSVVLSSPTTIDILFSPPLPDQGCYNIALTNAVLSSAYAIPGDKDVNVRSLWGDVTGDGQVVLGDSLAVKARVGQAVSPTNIRYDTNMAGGATLNLGDALAVKGRVSSPVKTSKCP